jgi:hypothetical protein
MLMVEASDDNGVAEISLLLNDKPAANQLGASLAWQFNPLVRGSGSHRLEVKARDFNGGVSSRVLNLRVPGNNPPVEEEPLPAEEVEELTAEDVFPILRGPQPDFYDPRDIGLAQPLIFGIDSNETLVDSVDITILGLDDRGVEAVSAAVGANQRWYAEGTQLNVHWDTTRQPDGPCDFHIYLLDRGLRVTHAIIPVILRNGPDHHGPEVTTNLPLNATYYGPFTLEVEAEDPAGVAGMELYFEINKQGARRKLANSATGRLQWTWELAEDNANFPDEGHMLVIEATDKLGNVSRTEGWLGIYYGEQWYMGLNAFRASRGVYPHYRLEAKRIVDRGQPAKEALRSFVFDNRDPALPAQGALYCWDLKAEDGSRLNYLPAGLYEFKLVMDDYSTTWKEAFIIEELESTEQNPIREGLDARSNRGNLPGMSWQNDERCRLLLSAAGDDRDILAPAKERFYNAEQRNYASAEALLLDEASLERASWVFLGHGLNDEAAALANPVALENLRTWVRDGGTLVASGSSYDFVEQLWPQRLAFSGADAAAGLSSKPQDLNAAETNSWPADCVLDSAWERSWRWPDGNMRVNAAAGPLPRVLATDTRVASLMTANPAFGDELNACWFGFGQGTGCVIYSCIPFSCPDAPSAAGSYTYLEYGWQILLQAPSEIW